MGGLFFDFEPFRTTPGPETVSRLYVFHTGMDMLSLAVPPLHTAPIFMHRGINNTKATAYEVPHWINLSFVDPERAADALAWVAAAAPRRARDG